MNAQLMSEHEIDFNKVIISWVKVAPYFIIFIVNNVLLAPKLLLKHRYWLYSGLLLVMLLFIFGGIAIDYIIDGNMVISNQNTPNSDANEIITDIYGSYIPTESRFNAAYTLGGGIRFGAIQFNVSNVRGIFNGTPYQEYILLQDNPLNITMSVMF